MHLSVKEFTPKSELERAYAQARGWSQLHAWRRGTSDLNSGRMGTATGIYLALVRKQFIEANFRQASETLNCILHYRELLSAEEDLSVVRILSSILREMIQDDELKFNSTRYEQITQVTLSFIAKLRSDKAALVDGLSVLADSTGLDFIEKYRDRWICD